MDNNGIYAANRWRASCRRPVHQPPRELNHDSRRPHPNMYHVVPPSPGGRGELVNPRLAATLGIAKLTVGNWLRDRPLGRAVARSLGTPRMTARPAARCESLYHRRLREWNRSRTDRRTESVVTENGDADTGSARSANGGTAGMPGNRRKSFPANDLPRPGCDFAAVRRSATLVNDVLQKRGAGTGYAEGPSLADGSGYDMRGEKWLRNVQRIEIPASSGNYPPIGSEGAGRRGEGERESRSAANGKR